ncbi:hyccin-like isoform X2 [Limulus polyphemus]|uniref:Hyccin-like isoform X2 n=1 Tax=Limulus polyphemus TaxID=6850 RepID=A0ABM1BJ89_LIMPO|nr:hyccin-like isoform X2 [Limulus polyphemus]
MTDLIVRDWIGEFQALSSSEVHSFAATIRENTELIQAVFTVLEEKKYHVEFLEQVCHQLFSFYRSREEELQRFTLQYIPTIIGIYLCAVARAERVSFHAVEVLLLGVYNLEVLNGEEEPVVQNFRLPSVSKPSIYHESISLPHSVLTEHALSKLEQGDKRTVSLGPIPAVEKITASNRLQIMTVLLKLYNYHISLMPRLSHFSICRMCSKLVKQGFQRLVISQRSSFGSEGGSFSTPHPRSSPRIPLSAGFLLELLHSVYFCMFNGIASFGIQALEDINFRAIHELFPEVIQVTNAIKNSLKVNPSGQPKDGPMGISVALSPSSNQSTLFKGAVTNASFRTRKLPDDIPLQSPQQEETPQSSIQHLASITEEQEESHFTKVSPSLTTKSQQDRISVSSKLPVLALLKDRAKAKKDKEAAIIDPNVTPSVKKEQDRKITGLNPSRSISHQNGFSDINSSSSYPSFSSDLNTFTLQNRLNMVKSEKDITAASGQKITAAVWNSKEVKSPPPSAQLDGVGSNGQVRHSQEINSRVNLSWEVDSECFKPYQTLV